MPSLDLREQKILSTVLFIDCVSSAAPEQLSLRTTVMYNGYVQRWLIIAPAHVPVNHHCIAIIITKRPTDDQ